MVTNTSLLAWEIPWTEEPQSHDWETKPPPPLTVLWMYSTSKICFKLSTKGVREVVTIKTAAVVLPLNESLSWARNWKVFCRHDLFDLHYSQVALVVKNLACLPMQEKKEKKGSIPGSGRSPGGGHGNLLQAAFMPGESHGQRSLAGYSPRGHKESDTTEAT